MMTHHIPNAQLLAFLRGKGGVYLKTDVVLLIDKILCGVAHVDDVVITKRLHQRVVTVHLHLEALQHDVAQTWKQRVTVQTPSRVAEKGGVNPRHLIPCHVDRTEDNETHLTAHHVGVADGDGRGTQGVEGRGEEEV